jgi:hypothetical protein
VREDRITVVRVECGGRPVDDERNRQRVRQIRVVPVQDSCDGVAEQDLLRVHERRSALVLERLEHRVLPDVAEQLAAEDRLELPVGRVAGRRPLVDVVLPVAGRAALAAGRIRASRLGEDARSRGGDHQRGRDRERAQEPASSIRHLSPIPTWK